MGQRRERTVRLAAVRRDAAMVDHLAMGAVSPIPTDPAGIVIARVVGAVCR